MRCQHCVFLEKTFTNTVDNEREYWLMTEVFLYLHNSDVCEEDKMKSNKVLADWVVEENERWGDCVAIMPD